MATRTNRLILLVALPFAVVTAFAAYSHWASRACCVQPLSIDYVRFENARRAADSVRPADFALVVEHGTASLAPEYHYDYEVRISSHGEAELLYWPGYGQADSLMARGHFTIDAVTLDSLWHLAAPLRESPGPRPSREIPDGGASPRITITGKNSTRIVNAWQPQPWAAQADDVAALVRATIPNAVWERASRRDDGTRGS